MKKIYIAVKPFSSAVFGNVSQGAPLDLNDAQAAQLIQHGLIMEKAQQVADTVAEPVPEKPKQTRKKKT